MKAQKGLRTCLLYLYLQGHVYGMMQRCLFLMLTGEDMCECKKIIGQTPQQKTDRNSERLRPKMFSLFWPYLYPHMSS